MVLNYSLRITGTYGINMTAETLLDKEKRDINCKCLKLRRVLDKNDNAWQVCLNCYAKERVYPNK